ncbi:MAG TPA: hypothetical protein VHQ41_01625 [Patescibacteria group bacterium]|nr:hypothetical protein [Patescibacteria group bacterium]
MFVNTASAQLVKDSRRAISLGTCVDATDLPDDVKQLLVASKLQEYANTASLSGMTNVSVKKAGWSTIGVWNERPANDKHGVQFCFTILDPNASIWVMNGDSKPGYGYLDGCSHPTIKGYKNRILVPPPEVVSHTEYEKCKLYDEKIVTPIMENGKQIGTLTNDGCHTESSIVREYQTEKPILRYVNACPPDLQVEDGVTMSSRLTGGKLGAGISFGGSALISLVRGSGGKAAIRDGLFGLGTQRAEQALNAGEDELHLTIPSSRIDKVIHKGHDDANLGDGFGILWKGDHAVIYRKMSEQSFVCYGEGLKSTSNLAIVTNGRNETIYTPSPTPIPTPTPAGRTKTTPTTGSPVPERPTGAGGLPCILGTSSCTTTGNVPIDPTRRMDPNNPWPPTGGIVGTPTYPDPTPQPAPSRPQFFTDSNGRVVTTNTTSSPSESAGMLNGTSTKKGECTITLRGKCMN